MSTIVYSNDIFALQRYGGISRYFCELASGVSKTPGFRAQVVAPTHFNDHLRDCDVPRSGVHVRLRGLQTVRLYHAANRALAPWMTRTARPSLLHRTYYSRESARSDVPTVVTVFDMIHELFAHEFSPSDPTSHNKRTNVEQADHVICISRSTAADLTRLFNVPPEKISVTYLGYSDSFSKTDPEHDSPPHARPYLLYVGHRDGYKNFRLTVEAYAASPTLSEAFDFVTFGGYAMGHRELEWIGRLGLRPHSVVRIVGSDLELARAYRHARMFVYPSRYEGFGIPPLEAMSAGCPVVCSNNSSIPEVVGDAAVLFDATDVDSIRNAMERVGFDELLRARLREAGHARVRQFSWNECVADTLAVYRKVLHV